MSKHAKRLFPFAILIVLIVIVYIANIQKVFSLSWLRDEHLHLKDYVHLHPIISPLVFIGFYVLSVCLVIPDSTILTLLGGFVFPLPLAILYSVVSEGIGSWIFYQIFHSVFHLPGLRINRPIIHKIQRELTRNPATYMLFLRISHVIPFWTTNIVAAYFRIKMWTFVWTTFLGVVPLSYILADAGRSLAHQLAANKNLTIADIFTLQVKLALLVMGILVISPLIYKNYIRRKR